jgi:outer membrane protein TolC
LAGARAQEIAARADWLVAVARLIYSTGGLTGAEALPQ